MQADEAQQAEATHVGRDATREEVDQPGYWDRIYSESENNSPGWNLGVPNDEFVWQLANALPQIKPGRLVVLGCGYGHDAAFFAEKGFEVTAVDFSPLAVAGARKNLEAKGLKAEVLEADVFRLPSRLDGRFDYVVEHTCFCAIHPSRRAEFATVAHRLLNPGGQLLGLFYFHQKEGGPPWNTTPDEVRRAFEPAGFDCRILVMAEHNIEKRRGKELFGRFYRK